MNKNQRGSSHIIVIGIMLVIAVIGFAVWNITKKKDTTSTNQNQTTETKQEDTNNTENTAKVQQSTANQSTQTTVDPNDTQYIEVAEWGVKIGVGPYLDKITVSKPNNYAENKSDLSIDVKPAFDLYENCTSGILITRLKDVSDFDEPPKNKVGDYYYYNSGVSECGGAKESGNTDTLGQTELRNQFDTYGVKSL